MEGNGNVLTADICQARNSMWSVTWRPSTWHPLNMSVPTAPAHLQIELLWKITWLSFIKTDVLNFVFSSFVPDTVESHMARLDGGAWQCLDCGYQSSKKFNVKIHVEAKHVTTSGYICPRCPTIHKNRIALMNHTAKFHKNSWKYVLKQFAVPLLFFLPETLESFMARLDGGQWQCLSCGYVSNKKFNVQCHVEAKHAICSGYNCPQCNEVLKNRIALKHHMAKFHKNWQ